MFSKTADPTTAPIPASSPPIQRPPMAGSNVSRSVLGADLRISGEITSTGAVEVLGEIDGDITANGLIIGQEGRVTGSINAGSVEVKGRLDGKVTCETFTLRASSVVKAEISTVTIVIESGAQIEGRFLKRRS